LPNLMPTYLGYPAELAWAPDNLAFYITQSEGSETGYGTAVYQLGNGRISPEPGFSEVVKHFELRHRCAFQYRGRDAGNKPNIAGLKWSETSSQLVVVAEVPPIGVCGQMGYFSGYLVEVSTGKILELYSPQQLMDRWRDALGERLNRDYLNLSPGERTATP